jgi:glutamyl-tRNA(Gln) amidotransferase subunit E
LTLEVLADALRAVARGVVAKEAVPDVLKAMGAGKATVEDAVRSLGLEMAPEPKIRAVVESVLARHAGLAREKGEAAFAPLMGEAMKELRGRADGAAVARVLKEELARLSGSWLS